MAVFVVITDVPNEDLDQAIAQIYPRGATSYRANDRTWFLSADKIISVVSSELGLTNGGRGMAAVFRVTLPGAGWHQKSLWEWLSLKEASG
ncbi:MAG TPA: hypothetical protein VII73_11780 [Caulobacteraceae bacterium]